MKKVLLSLGLVVLVSGLASAQSSENSDVKSAGVSAEVITPIALSKTTDLNFGQVVATGSSGTVTISAGGSLSVTGGAFLGHSTSISAAAFAVSGQTGASYSISTDSSITIDDGSSDSMTVDSFSPSKSSGTLEGGVDTFSVGATLNVAANQPVGSYTGSFNVTVAYN